MSENHLSKNLEETRQAAEAFLASSKPSGARAFVVGLSGDLGSGKTTFTQAIAKKLNITETVTSPTFVIEKIYKLENNSTFEHFIHIDAYRLESGKELENLGWKETVSNPKNLIFIEWPEKVAEVLPPSIQMIHFKFIDENTREITYG